MIGAWWIELLYVLILKQFDEISAILLLGVISKLTQILNANKENKRTLNICLCIKIRHGPLASSSISHLPISGEENFDKQDNKRINP